MGFNRRIFQLLKSYERHEENKRKIGQERSSMQQAGYHRHQARSEEEEKERMKDRKLMERKAVQQNKNTLVELNKAYLGTAQVNKVGEGTMNFA